MWLYGGDHRGHPGPQGQCADDLLAELVLVGGAPQSDAAQFAHRAPQPDQVADGGELLGPDGFGGATPVDLGGFGALGDSGGELHQESRQVV